MTRLRVAANYLVYGAIGTLAPAQAWPDDKPLTWKFWVALALGLAIALKALMSKAGESGPVDANIVNTPAEPVPVATTSASEAIP